MHEMRLGEKGQITLPMPIRNSYGMHKGDSLRILDRGNGIMEVILLKHSSELPPPVVRATRQKKSHTQQQMKEAAASAAVERYKRTAGNQPRK